MERSFANFDVVDVFKDGVFLYRTTKPKPLPTEAENLKIMGIKSLNQKRPNRHRVLTDDVVEKIKAMHYQGKRPCEISKELNLNYNTVRSITIGK